MSPTTQNDKTRGVAALAPLAVLGLAAAGLIGCSADQHTYKSTFAAPKSVAVVYTQTGETAWSMDIPIDHTLEIDFKREGDWQGFSAPATPATSFSWSLDSLSSGGRSDNGTVELSGEPVHLRPSLRPVGQDVKATTVPAPSPVPPPPPAMIEAKPAQAPEPAPAISEEATEAPAPAAPEVPAMNDTTDVIEQAASDLEEAATAAEPIAPLAPQLPVRPFSLRADMPRRTPLTRCLHRLAFALCLSAGWAVPTLGQGSETYVDQAVGDLDPLSESIRRIDPAVGRDLNTGRIRLIQPTNREDGFGLRLGFDAGYYEYRAPGVRAVFQRPDYLTRNRDGQVVLNQTPATDGEYLELIPPNTVFNLSNPYERPMVSTPSYAPPQRIGQGAHLLRDTRIENFITPAQLQPLSQITMGMEFDPQLIDKEIEPTPQPAIKLQPWFRSSRIDAEQVAPVEETD
jgi:hypothetical protein